jgi:hypothetical protein
MQIVRNSHWYIINIFYDNDKNKILQTFRARGYYNLPEVDLENLPVRGRIY